ncbi:unnamed protein product [Pipistrellus nathusii]|uniref:Uncharacterized protein n=1 Tax=Pipistrellus nathusii TaxID=59473 RepID=A0ABN9ZLF3_PIPNA
MSATALLSLEHDTLTQRFFKDINLFGPESSHGRSLSRTSGNMLLPAGKPSVMVNYGLQCPQQGGPPPCIRPGAWGNLFPLRCFLCLNSHPSHAITPCCHPLRGSSDVSFFLTNRDIIWTQFSWLR